MKHLVEPVVSVSKGCGDPRSKAAPDSTGPSPSATPALAPGRCPLVRKLQDLKKNSRQDEKLQQLKARIHRQQQRCISRASTECRMPASSAVESPTHRQPCPKKKVRKIAFVSPTPANTVQRGRAAKKKQHGTGTSPLLEKAQKVQAVHAVNVFAWREGQKLARKILGPLLKNQKLRSGSEGEAAPFAPEPKRHRVMDEVKQSLGEQDGAMPRARRNVGQERKENQMLVDKENPRGSRNRSTRPPNNLGAEKRTVKSQGVATGREEKGRFKAGPDAHHSPGAHLVDPGRPSAVRMGQKRGSPQRSHTPGKESSPPPRRDMARRGSRSPEQIHAFMDKTLAERNKRFREEKLASKRAQEARNARLQEVYRKQREAFRRRKSGSEVWRGNQAANPTACAKAICGLEREREEQPRSETRAWLHRSSQALLKNEALDQEITRTAEAGRISDSPTVASCRTTPSKKPIFGLQEWTPWEKSAVSPSPAKENRVKALHVLAQDLNERLDREMGKLRVINKPMSLERQGALSGAPTLSTIRKPEIPQTGGGGVQGGDTIWDSRFSQNPSRDAGRTQEKIVYGDGFAAHPDKGLPGLLTSRPCSEILRQRSSEEKHEEAGSVDVHRGCAANEGLHGDKNLFQGHTRPGGLMATPQRLPGRQSISSRQNIGPQEDGTEDHFGLQPGSRGHILAQPQACGTSLLSVNHGNTVLAEEPVDRSEPPDSTSQWSEISPFYGSSSTFRHFGLSMVEQSLREEELRARHQVALLRLREDALQEKTKAELAWLEHEASCRKSLGDDTETSAFVEKQSMLRTKLKQEQAEICHLQNLCRAAHQERKLLLKQQKDLLVLQQTTAQLWRQLCEQSGKSPQQMLNIYNKDTDEASRSGKSRDGSGRQGKGKGSLPAERREISPRGMKTEQQFLKQTPWVDAQPVGPAVMGSAVSNQEEGRNGQDTGLRKLSMQESWHPTDKEAGHWTSAMPRDERRSFSPYTEKPHLDLEFHKAHAVLISISGSSFSASDVEAEDGQDTDVSLPEEFVFQEEPPYNSNGTFCDTPAMSQITSNPRNAVSPDSRHHTAVLCGDSKQGRLSVPCKQEKMMEDLPNGERIYEGRSVMPSANGRPKLGSVWTRGSHSVQASMSASGRKASSLSGSDPESCMERRGAKTLAFQGAADVSCHCSEEEPRWKGAGPGVGPAEGTWNGENPSHFEDEPTTHVPEILLKTVESVSNTAPLSGSEGRAGSNEYAANESQSSRGDKATVQCPKISTEEEGSSRLQHSKSTGRITKERENSSLVNSQNSTELGMATLHPRSSKAGLLRPAQSCLPRSEDATVLPSEDEIVSPVDEVLSYGSTDLPWSTEKDVSFPIEDLPPPPKDLSGNDRDSSHSFQDFPSPPEEVAFPEMGGCQYASEEDTSGETNDASSSERLPS